MILAAEALADRSQAIALSVDGVREQGAFFKSWNTAGLGNKKRDDRQQRGRAGRHGFDHIRQSGDA
jgi:hypothetical protein